MMLDQDVKISVEETKTDMADTDLHLASSGSETSSPPVEVITIDQDEDGEYGNDQPQVTLLQDVQANELSDPTADFPFHDATETYQDTVLRLTNFMHTRKALVF
jgi:ubiquitin carboxyl-terminal hydrolase 34